MAKHWLNQNNVQHLKLKLMSNRSTDDKLYNQSIVYEVATLIVGDIDTSEERDIIMQAKQENLQRINEFHVSYLDYQHCPLRS